MKILIITNIFPPKSIGGYELGAHEIAEMLHDDGNQVVVLTSNYFLGDIREKYPIFRSLKLGLFEKYLPTIDYAISEFNLQVIDHYLNEFKPDIVLMFNLAGLGALGVIKYVQLSQRPSILYLMDNIFSDSIRDPNLFSVIAKSFNGLDFNKSTKVISMSKRLIEEINQQGIVSINQYILIPGWASFFSKKKETPFFQKNFYKFIFASRIAPHKGTELLLDAISDLVAHGIKNFKIDFYGDGLIYDFIASSKIKGVSNFISYKGSLTKDELLYKYSGYDALIFPTWPREPFGFVVSEAMASCTPVLLTKGTGSEEWLTDECSISFEHNSKSISQAIKNFMILSDHEKLDLSNNAGDFAIEYFNKVKCFDKIKEVIKESISDNPIENNSGNLAALRIYKKLFT